MGLWIDVKAFRCIHLNRGPTLDSEPHDFVSWPLDRSRGIAFEGARPVGLGFCPILLIFGTPALAIKTHPKLLELVRIKQIMNGT